MTRTSCLRFLAITALLLPLSVQALTPGIASPAVPRPDRIIVRLKADAPDDAIAGLNAKHGARVLKRIAHARGPDVVALPPGLAVAQAVASYRASPLVEYAEPDYLLQTLAVPNDPRYLNLDQWNLNNTGIYGGTAGADISAEAGWELQTDASGIIVGLVDSGVRYTHEDLAANMWVNPGESGLDAQGADKRTNGIDDDNNGYIDDVHGLNVLNHTGDPLDDWGHGTHVAGILGARGNNGVGIAGVAWGLRIMAVKFIDANVNYSVSDAIIGLEYARINGAKIINASWGGYAFTSQALHDEFMVLRDAGIIVTAAVGNDNSDNDVMPLYPASYEFDNIVAVAATDRNDQRAWYSNYGLNTVDLGAPGSPVFSTWGDTDQSYQYFEGTSMAAPHAAGALALLWSRFPGDTYQQIIQRLLTTVDVLPALNGVTRSNGRLNLAAALATGPSTPPPVVTVPPAAPTSLVANATSKRTVALAWIDHATDETGFEVEQSRDGAAFTRVATVGADATAATIGGLSQNSAYTFRVRAVRGVTPSDWSNVAAVTIPKKGKGR